MGKAITVKRGTIAKAKPRGKPFTGKGDPRNGHGAPKRGESWAEIIKTVFNMTGADIAAYASPLAKQLRTVGDTVTLKEAVILRVAVSLMNEPTPGLFKEVMERAEGKVKDEGENHDELVIRIEREPSQPTPANAASGTGTD